MRLWAVSAVLIAGCSRGPYHEISETTTRYLGEAVVADVSDDDKGDTVYTFDSASGPICMNGDDFTTSLRRGTSDDLVIFLQGGGACWSDFCLAIETAPPGIPTLAFLDPTHEANPVADDSLAYVPYCDGSLFAGDVEVDEDHDGVVDRTQFGLRNLSAALDVTKAEFPEPRRIVLAGLSGGAFGTIMATPVIRELYPDTPIDVINDSGVGVGMGAVNPGFVGQLVNEWNATGFLPESCEGCIDDGHLTRFVNWELERDENLRIAAFSSYGDKVIADIFLGVGEPVFRADLTRETDVLMAAHPDRYAAFLVEGQLHTVLAGDIRGFLGEDVDNPDAFEDLVEIGSMHEVAVDGVTVEDWLRVYLTQDASWGPVIE
jgi:hypothetical protein